MQRCTGRFLESGRFKAESNIKMDLDEWAVIVKVATGSGLWVLSAEN
jgi:hypothetical protein